MKKRKFMSLLQSVQTLLQSIYPVLLRKGCELNSNQRLKFMDQSLLRRGCKLSHNLLGLLPPLSLRGVFWQRQNTTQQFIFLYLRDQEA